MIRSRNIDPNTDWSQNQGGADIDWTLGAQNNATAFMLDAGLFTGVGAIGVGRAAVNTAAFTINPPAKTAVAATNYSKLRVDNSSAVTVPAGTTALVASVHIDEPNITATGTVTNAATLYVEAAPTEGGTGNYALWVDAGVSRFDGDVVIGAAVVPTNPQANFAILPQTRTATANQSFFHSQLLPGGATTVPTGTAPVVASLNVHEPNITATGTVTDAATVRIVDAPTEGSFNWALWVDAGATRLDGTCYIGDTDNANVTLGLTINQGAADDTILSLKSSDVAHGVTTAAETDTYGLFRKYVANNGGLEMMGLDDAGDTGLALTAVAVTANATRSTSGAAPIMLKAHLKSGTGLASVGADKNLLTVSDNGTVRFVLDSDGDSFQDVGTAWTNFDDHEDATLLTDLSIAVSRDGDPLKEQFGDFLRYNREHLQRVKLVEFNEDGHHFVNMSRLTMLLVGAVRQVNDRLAATEAKLADALASGSKKALAAG